MSRARRVVITGCGAVTSIGADRESFWRAALAGTDGVRPLRFLELPAARRMFGGQVPPETFPAGRLEAELLPWLGYPAQFALAAAREAMGDAGLYGPDAAASGARPIDPWRFGVCLGSGTGNPRQTGAAVLVWREKGLERIPRRSLPKMPASGAGAALAQAFDLRGPHFVFTTSCMAGNGAIARAADLVAAGRADAMLTGGAEAMSWVMAHGFGMLTNLRGEPLERSRPFSAGRRGVVVGEGAGVLVVESLESARRRGARVYAEVLGSGFASDAHHMSSPHPEGLGGIAAVRQGLARAGVAPERVDYVSAHGTGSDSNDVVETKILRQVLGDAAPRVPVSSIKSMLGHSLGAASALEAIVCALAIRDGRIPPTINFDEPDPRCDLDWVPNRSRRHRVDVALSTAFAFGGACSALVFGRAQEA